MIVSSEDDGYDDDDDDGYDDDSGRFHSY